MTKRIFSLLLACVLFLCVGCSNTANGGEETQAPKPEVVDSVLTLGDNTGVYGTLFGQGRVIDIAITADSAAYTAMTQSDSLSQSVQADITINGNAYKNVGLSLQDDLSLSLVKEMGSSRYSFCVDADAYSEGQTMNGLDCLNLCNLFGDPSYMRAYLYGMALAHIGGMPPFMAYANVSLNGESVGFYLCTEGIAESYAKRVAGEGASFVGEEGMNAIAESYASYVDTVPVNADSLLRSFAVNAYLGSFTGYMDYEPHNYTLIRGADKAYHYIENKTDLAMGAYHMDGGKTVTLKLESPVYLSKLESRPVLEALMANNDTYLTYLDYVEDLVEFFSEPEALCASLEAVIGSYIEKDATAFFSAEDHRKDIVFSGVELSELLGDPGNVLVDSGADVGVDFDSQKPGQEKPVTLIPKSDDYKEIKGLVDYIIKRTSSVRGELGL